MNEPNDRDGRAAAVRADRGAGFGGLRYHLVALSLLCVAIAVFYLDTFAGIVEIWLRSETYLHGFLILPISLYLLRHQWPALAEITPRGYLPAAVALLASSVGWWLSGAIGIQVGEQLIVFALIPLAVTAVMGIEFARKAAFPLAYLVFAVPFGEALIPALMDYTATFTVHALNVTGIPVMRDGLYFSIPAGNFEVAKACSGFRYLLATLALGTLYGYLAYTSTKKRLIFLGFSIVLPIVANGIRAYLIVLIAHFSEMRLAVGVDHIVFGWIFFGIVIAIMFTVGNRYRDDHDAPPGAATPAGARGTPAAKADSSVRLIVLFAVSLLFVAAGPLLLPRLPATVAATDDTALHLPRQAAGWSLDNRAVPDWRPLYHGASAEAYGRYTDGTVTVDLFVIQYRSHNQDAELVNSENFIADPDRWQVPSISRITVPTPEGDSMSVRATVAQNPRSGRLIWHWFDVDGRRAASDIGVKFLELKALLSGVASRSTVIAISTAIDGTDDEARSVMQRFLDDASTAIQDCLADSRPPARCAITANAGTRR